MASCFTVGCEAASECPLDGGCIHATGRKRATLGPPPHVEYNPMMGSRLDLVVHEEPEAVALKRWNVGRRAYLESLLAGNLSPETRAIYRRELARLPAL